MDLAVPWAAELALTVLCAALCSLLFLAVYVQLWLLLRYRQKRLSYQSLLLFLCLLWASLRTVLFSFHLATDLQPFPLWLLYCTPICLQFFTLCILNLYFSQVIFKARCSQEFNRYKLPLHLGFFLVSLAFVIVNVSCTILGASNDPHGWITMTRMIFNDFLFAACSICLANHTYRIATTAPAYVYLESKGSSGGQAIAVGSIISALYIMRALYNFAMSIQPEIKPSPFSYGWNSVRDRAVSKGNDSLEYLTFGIFLLFCEFLPMCLMTYFFRAKRMGQNLQTAGMVNSHSFGSRAYFFDNPRRYDSDEDLPRLSNSRGGSLASTPKTSGWYGTICPTSGCATDPPTGTPILFTCGPGTLG